MRKQKSSHKPTQPGISAFWMGRGSTFEASRDHSSKQDAVEATTMAIGNVPWLVGGMRGNRNKNLWCIGKGNHSEQVSGAPHLSLQNSHEIRAYGSWLLFQLDSLEPDGNQSKIAVGFYRRFVPPTKGRRGRLVAIHFFFVLGFLFRVALIRVPELQLVTRTFESTV